MTFKDRYRACRSVVQDRPRHGVLTSLVLAADFRLLMLGTVIAGILIGLVL